MFGFAEVVYIAEFSRPFLYQRLCRQPRFMEVIFRLFLANRTVSQSGIFKIQYPNPS